MLTHALSGIICEEFKKSFPWNAPDSRDTGMLLDFRLHRKNFNDPDNLQMFIWGQHNYIGVFVRITEFIGQTVFLNETYPWHVLSYHDSGWRDGVHGTINQFQDMIAYVDNMGNFNDWYRTVAVSSDTAKHFMNIEQNRRDNRGKVTPPKAYDDAVQEATNRGR